MSETDEHITRVTRSRTEAKQWYNTLSPWYDWVADPFERAHRATGVELLDPEEGERVLDIGCGTGNALVRIARLVGEEGHVIGLDIADEMCRIAQQNVAGASVAEQVEVVSGDALSLPFRNDSLDSIFMSFTLELFDTPDIPVVLTECRRVLREDGSLCVVALSKRDAGLLTSLYERIHTAVPKYVDCRPIFVRRTLRHEGFDIVDSRDEQMAGLAVEIVLAKVSLKQTGDL